jgi:hypothetical protein
MSASIIELRPATPPPPQPPAVFTMVFEGKPGDAFSAINQAQGFLAARGFSFGPGCVSGRTGVMFGRGWIIAKWRNLTPLEQRQCHGVIEGDRRNGPVTLKIFFHAPAFALAALGSPEVAGAIVTAWSEQR